MSAPKPPSFKFTKRQLQANILLAGIATFIMLFGGGRSGKSFIIIRALVMRALKAPYSRHAILRFRFNHCKQSIVLDTFPKVMKICFPDVEYHIDKSDWYLTLPNGSEIWFGGLDDKHRTEKILGMEFVTIFLNECSQISFDAMETVLTRLAQLVHVIENGVDRGPLAPRMYFDENPPSKAHWTYKMFILHLDPDSKKIQKDPGDYVYLKMNPADNMENLTATYLKTLDGMSAKKRKRFKDGEFSDVIANSLFDEISMEKWRVIDLDDAPEMIRILVAVDPSGSDDVDNADNDEIGICAGGLGTDGNGYLIADATVKAGPATWGKIVTDLFDRLEANAVVGEVNFGGAMVKHVIQTARPRTPYIGVTASRGKHVRAEPVSALTETGKIRHIGYFPELEEELANMTPNGYIGTGSPNRADAYVWLFQELFNMIVKKKEKEYIHRDPPNWRAR